MGLYINMGNDGFRAARNGEYVDKSALIELVNNSLNSERQFMCVSRARRFGKSMAAKKKYKIQSALNNFEEYTMISPGEMAACFGFTDEEVTELCLRNEIDKEQIKIWYDGYRIGGQESIYNLPRTSKTT